MPKLPAPEDAAYLRFVAAVASTLGSGFTSFRKGMAIRRARAQGYDVILFHRIWDHQPDVEVELIVGRSFKPVGRVHRRIGASGTICQIQGAGHVVAHALSVAAKTRWRFKSDGPPESVVKVASRTAIEVGQPFFERFSGMRAARDALASSDSWCGDGYMRWANVLVLDLALNDHPHFEEWSKSLSAQVQEQANFLVQQYASAA